MQYFSLILAWAFMYGLYNKSEKHYKIVHFPISVTLYLQFFYFNGMVLFIL